MASDLSENYVTVFFRILQNLAKKPVSFCATLNLELVMRKGKHTVQNIIEILFFPHH